MPDFVTTPETDETAKTLEYFWSNFPVSTDTDASVFLGGSANPTLWRFVEAIPALDQAGLSYFNPQVKEWASEQIETEALAKAKAKVLLFVVDAETRAISTLVEATEAIVRGRPTVLVIMNVPEGAVIGGETVGPNQREDINRGRAYLADAAKRHQVPVYDNLQDALRQVIAMAKQ